MIADIVVTLQALEKNFSSVGANRATSLLVKSNNAGIEDGECQLNDELRKFILLLFGEVFIGGFDMIERVPAVGM
jgi:hypothetical protein